MEPKLFFPLFALPDMPWRAPGEPNPRRAPRTEGKHHRAEASKKAARKRVRKARRRNR